MAAIKPGDVVVDPLCGGGSIPIEVSIIPGLELGHYDCMHFGLNFGMNNV